MNLQLILLLILLYNVKQTKCCEDTAMQKVIPQHIKLVSQEECSNIDGTSINANTIEYIRKFRKWILKIVEGKLNNKQERIGIYSFKNKSHSISSLVEYEHYFIDSQEENAQLQELLETIKDEIIKKAHKFMVSSNTSRNLIASLAQEECIQRGITNSLLHQWSCASETEQATIIKNNISTFASLLHFSVDLLHFLTDIIYSFPIADAQFKLRVTKWEKVTSLLPEIFVEQNQKVENVKLVDFLKYIKLHDLDLLTVSEITKEQIWVILHAYLKRIDEHTRTN